MDEIEAQGQYDLDCDGLRRSRNGRVGARMIVQVAVLGSDTLLKFWDMDGDGHQRRFLVDARTGRTWLDNGRDQAVRQATKYDEPISAILQARSN